LQRSSIVEYASEYVPITKPDCEDLANRIGYNFKFNKADKCQA